MYAYCILPSIAVQVVMAKKFNLKKLRAQHGLSQKEMANKLGVNQATVSKIEAGKLDPNRTLAILLTFLLESGHV